jgi:poly(3-hydroxybutyrate) depolymerase
LALVTSVSASVAKRLFCVSALTLSATTVSCGGAPTAPSTGGRSIVVNGASRTYTLHVPAAFRRNVGALVIALHGAGDTGLSFERSTGLSAKADQAGFAVIYPDGLFNARLGATDWQHFGDDFADDVSFVRQLIASVTRDIQSDPTGRTLSDSRMGEGRPIVLPWNSPISLPPSVTLKGRCTKAWRVFRRHVGQFRC